MKGQPSDTLLEDQGSPVSSVSIGIWRESLVTENIIGALISVPNLGGEEGIHNS